MNLELRDKVAIVTGASRGIGRAISKVFAAEGMNLVLVALNAAPLDSVAADCGEKAVAVATDLRRSDAAQTIVDAALSRFGRIDVLVNNAGATKSGDFLTLGDDDWDDGFALKFFGAMRCTRAAWPHLMASKGCVVNVAGVGGRTGQADTAIGGSVNAAMLNLTKSLADRGIKDGVRVNAVNPSAIVTDRLQAYLGQLASAKGIDAEDARAELAVSLKIVGLGTPEEVARAVAFLASPAMNYCQGAILDIDGGQTRTL